MSSQKKIPSYDFKKIEKKWQKEWEKSKIYQPNMDKAKKPFYNLMMFPYPSAEGMHVGSMYTFSGVDTFGRFKKMQGYDVFEPIGLDGFGIHAENYAMKIGEHIKDVSKRTEKNYYKQLREIGNMHDWSRTVETYKPEYYQWTQWLFLQMYQKGLAYQKEAKVNWCPSCKTVLSDEQVIIGACERCESVVEKKNLKQWFFKITAYADKLLKNLTWIDWPEDVKLNQKNWIGKSEGAMIKFKIVTKKSQETIEVFTTRPDTLFGVTYMVLAPEHKLVKKFKKEINNWSQVKKYISRAIKRSEQERNNEKKEKTGIELKGVWAINPINHKRIPVFIADYVLAGYGTGAIMAVPAHDKRDYDFAKKYGLEIKQVIVPRFDAKGKDAIQKNKPMTKRSTVDVIIKHWKEDKFFCLDWNKSGNNWHSFVIGGVKKGETLEEAALREAQEESGYKNMQVIKQIGGEVHSYFYATHKKVNRAPVKRNCIYIELIDGEWKEPEKKHTKNHQGVWIDKDKIAQIINLPEIKRYWDIFLGKEETLFTGLGELINSERFNGTKSKLAKKAITKFVGGRMTYNYKLRDWCISRQRYWGPPIPIVWCNSCALKKKKIKVLIIHGFEGSGRGNWLPWLKKELEQIGCEVFTPTLKDRKHPTVKSWNKQLKVYLNKLDENSVIIGHSSGSKALLHLLNSGNKKVSQVFLIASALGTQKRNWDWFRKEWPKSDIDSLEKFWKQKVDWKDVNRKIKETYVIVSSDDPYISTEHIKDIKIKNKTAEIWKGQKHFQQKKNTKLRDYIIENIIKNIKPITVPVPEKDLPVKLPPMEDFLPEGKGKGPLAKNEKFVQTKCPVCGEKAERETDVSDPFVDSSWYFFRYPSTEIKDKPFDKKRTKKWLPVDSYIGGKEHTVLHLLYSRFITMVLKDLGYIDFDEPYKRFFGHGLITKDGAKMSKSKGNVINPDEMIEKYGADTVRLYLRFLGDFSQGGDWRDTGAEGMHRFIKKLWKLFYELAETDGKGINDMSTLDKSIKVIGEDIEKLSFNTAVARYMELVNWVRNNKNDFSQQQVLTVRKVLALLIAPMAPHLAEEFWLIVNGHGRSLHNKSIFNQAWPKFNPKNIIDETFELVIQVNGKVRDKIKTAKSISEKEVREIALKSEKIQKFLNGEKPKKIIYVPGRLVNIVV